MRTALVCCCALALAVAGCDSKNNNDTKRVQVNGKITLDGKALATGKISFDLANGEPPATFDILDGRYEGRAPLGKCKVMINSVQKVSMKEKMKMDGPGYDQVTEENILPARYNTSSEITREVVEGTNEFNFELKTK
jgi:hypothetical protein